MTSLALTHDKAAAAIFIGFAATLAAAVAGPSELLPASALLAFGLGWAAMVDIDRFILPDVITLGLVLAGLAFALAGGLAEALPFIAGAIAGYAALALIAETYRRLRGQRGLGMGDAKLLAVSGAWLGWKALPVVVLLASLGCIAVVAIQAAMNRRTMPVGPIPFGPYLAAATWGLWLVDLSGGR